MTRALAKNDQALCLPVFFAHQLINAFHCVPHQIIPAKPINPITLRVVEGKTILIGGVARVELLEVIICLICSIFCFNWGNGSKICFVKTVTDNFSFCFRGNRFIASLFDLFLFFSQGRPFFFTFFTSSEVKLHVTQTVKVEDFIQKHVGELVLPPARCLNYFCACSIFGCCAARNFNPLVSCV